MAMASLMAWYVFIFRVSLPPTMLLEDEETQVRPGEWRAESRLDLRRMDEAKAGKWPSAGGGWVVAVELQRRKLYKNLGYLDRENMKERPKIRNGCA